MKNTELLTAASKAAADGLVELLAYSGEDCPDLSTRLVEHIIVAATAHTLIYIEGVQRKQERLQAVGVLRPHLCGDCLELLDPEPEPAVRVGEGDEDVPGSVELAEYELFCGWARRAADLVPPGKAVREGSLRFDLIAELHASVAERHPLGIAESLYSAIGALHCGDDRDAVVTLGDLAAAELWAAKSEKAAGIITALRVLVGQLNEDQIPDAVSTWTLEELEEVEAWAAIVLNAGPTETVVIIKPEVVVALERELKA